MPTEGWAVRAGFWCFSDKLSTLYLNTAGFILLPGKRLNLLRFYDFLGEGGGILLLNISPGKHLVRKC